MSIRQAVLTALLTAGIVGGGAAAASLAEGSNDAGVLEETPTTLAPDVTTTTVEPGDDVTDPDEGDEDGDGEAAGVERWYEGCGDFTEGTHGDYVRQAAHDPNATLQSVSEAAHSPCGKPIQSVKDEEGDDGDGEGDDEEVVDPVDPIVTSQSHGNGGGNGNAGGNGKGNAGSKSQGRGRK
jgi:hypothetical protein